MVRRRVEEPVSHERWLISYADFITLLFAFFVVMYSISQVNESKYRVLSETLNHVFTEAVPRTLDPIQVGDPQLRADPSVIPDGGEEEVDQAMNGDGAFDRTADLPQLSDLFEDEFSDLIDDDVITINSNEFWLEIQLNASILFDTGDAEPSLQAESIFSDVAKILRDFDNPVQVEGFTDNVPIRNAQFPSNWELSGARAAAVVKLLQQGQVGPDRLSAVGYGEHQPIADNTTEEGRAINRRVALMIARERAERPGVESQGEIAQAVTPAMRESSSPYPQSQDITDNSPEDSSLPSSQAAEAALEVEIEDEGAPDILGRLLEGEGGDLTDSNDSQAETPEASVDRLAPVGEIQPVELDGGGLLFSSDPALERN